jgi:hypothetical protein
MSRELLQQALNALLISAPLGHAVEDYEYRHRLIKDIEAELAKPEQDASAQFREDAFAWDGEAWGEMAKQMSRDFVERVKKNWESPPKSVGTITIGELRKTDLYRRMATQSLREAFAPSCQWVGLTDDEINDLEKKLRDNGDYCSLHFAWCISAKLKGLNT